MDPFSQMMYQYYVYSSMRGLIPIPMMNNNNYIYQMNVGQNDITLANEANYKNNEKKKFGRILIIYPGVIGLKYVNKLVCRG